MGLSDKDIVALSGGTPWEEHMLTDQALRDLWTKEPLKFDNSYFVELLKGDSKGLLQLPTDKALLEDPLSFVVTLNFMQTYYELVLGLQNPYAKDEEKFFKDYAESHKKPAVLGFYPSSFYFGIKAKYVQSAVGDAAAAAAVVVLSYLFEVHRRDSKKRTTLKILRSESKSRIQNKHYV